MSLFEKVVAVGLIIIFLPALANPGVAILVAVVLGILWVAGMVLGREGLDLLKKQHIGSKARRNSDLQDTISGDTDRDWGRE